MFPVDSEFVILYISYLGWLLLLLSGLLFGGRKRTYITHLIVYIIYGCIMAYVFSDKQNFRYGGSLAVLFYGAAFLSAHILWFSGQSMYLFFTKRRSKHILK